MNGASLAITLPAWVSTFLENNPQQFPDDTAKMAFCIRLAGENIRHGGGPFGAAVFDEHGMLVSVGINLVTLANSSILHAEMVAISLAQLKLQRYDLSDGGQHAFTLATTTEPCAMCFGAIPWSGITHLLCGARDEDARAIGFDEGPKLPQWREALVERGITVRRDLMRVEAAALLETYRRQGGEIYNAKRKDI